MQVLVTGGAGFIGSNLTDQLLADGHSVVVLDDFNDYYQPDFKRQNVLQMKKNSNCRIVEGDITSRQTVRDLFGSHRFDMVIHLAARAGVRASLKDPFLYQRVNVEGTLNILEAMREFGVKKLTFGSTSSVYGSNTKIPFSESDPLFNTISPYAATKLAGEALCRSYSHLHKLDIAVVRFFTVYGPRGRPDMAMYLFAKQLAKGLPIQVFGDGSSSRDYTYVDDIVQGVAATIRREFGYEIFNLGESDTIQMRDLIQLLEQTMGVKAQIERLPDQPGDVPHTFADISKAQRILGYNPKTKVRAGVPKLIQWLKENGRI
ncbi:MAG: GDP-mannose 4,6-dehydratase [Verrucomicrobiae bacterium]|nr:GDP-mannose 4,6-dehydratase [Verrucomicrobiae bacterium]